jgi:hypothetical protein
LKIWKLSILFKIGYFLVKKLPGLFFRVILAPISKVDIGADPFGALSSTQLEQVSEASGKETPAMLGATEGGIVVSLMLFTW